MKIVVNDANVLIDLIKLDFLPQFFSLPYQFYTTEVTLEELHAEQAQQLEPFLTNGSLVIETLDENAMLTIFELMALKPQLSQQDCSALVCAQGLAGRLLTSDNTLRKFAETQNVTVNGHLWVLDELVDKKVITGLLAIDKLNELQQVINPKLGLPKAACRERTEAWHKTSNGLQ